MKMNILYRLLLVMVLGLPAMGVRAQSQMASLVPDAIMQEVQDLTKNGPLPIKVDPASRVWLQGSANIVDFECNAGLIDSEGTITGLDTTTEHRGAHGPVVLEVRIPIQQMNCGKSGINRDMRRTLNADSHPYIVYRLGANRLIGTKNSGNKMVFEIETFGELEISGVEKTRKIIVEGEFIGDWKFRVKGMHPVQMSEYSLDPPSPLMGLIRVNDELQVHFDVILTLR